MDIARTIRKKAKAIVFAATFILTSTTQADLHGARSSFLTGGPEGNWTGRYGMSLVYLSDNYTAPERAHFKNILLNNGDTHIDLYARAKTGGYHGTPINGYADHKGRLQDLNDSGLKPVIWLTGEGRQGDTDEPLSTTLNFIDHYVRTNDNLISGYVTCLECDENYSPAEVNAMVAKIKSVTNKPVGIHLTPGVGGHSRNTNYYKDADYIYLQFGDHLTGDYTADTDMAVAMLREALTLGIPVIANEYSIQSTSAQAKALGDRLCAEGAVGTGNGRSVEYCGQREEKKKSWIKKNETTLIGVTAAAIGIYMVSRMQLPIYLQASDNGYLIGIDQPISENASISFDIDNTDRMTGRFNWRF